MNPSPLVSIIIPVVNKLEFTRQCLDRIGRYASDRCPLEVIVIDNGSTDGTREFFEAARASYPLRYVRNETNLGFARGNNLGASLSRVKYLLFLNNDTIVTSGWLESMVSIAEQDPQVGIVGIKQLFPYTNRVHHTGIVIAADRRPVHIYPHEQASKPYVNKQREYQAVTGSCLLIPRELFAQLGMFDEEFVNGYEDVDLCFKARYQAGRKVVCCTKSFIYHYGQISETRTDDDRENAARFATKWAAQLRADEHVYFRRDRPDRGAQERAARVGPIHAPGDLIYFADDLSSGSALTWVLSELILALHAEGAPVALRRAVLPKSLEAEKRRRLKPLMWDRQPVGGIQIRWSHYWPQHLNLELTGRLNLELFVINYIFGKPGTEPWDRWLQCLPQNHYGKLPLSTFCRDVLGQLGIPEADCHVLRPGRSPEIDAVGRPSSRPSRYRFLTVTNSHDLERYGTLKLLDAYWRAFRANDDVELVVKDYGAASGDTTLRSLLSNASGRARVEYVTEFTTKQKLIELYRSCDAFVSAHRGEGYAMKILDATACGLPVIAPLFGGPADFCTADNCYPIEFDLIPVGDCLDTKSLQIRNAPMWAEPRLDSLMTQLRRVANDPKAAREIGERCRREADHLTWQNAARGLTTFLESFSGTDRVPVRPAVKKAVTERSPYWLGRRVSVLIPTHNRRETLRKCLAALERQTVLPQEFEVVVIDDGSSDGTAEMLSSLSTSFRLKYLFQPNRGPGAARNAGLQHADGEIVLFLGDDIIADERLLEQHLLAHAARPDASAAVLGHIDWPPDLPRSEVMEFVCGESTLQFAYEFIPKLPALDYRFFYTSNISLKRAFMLEAAQDRVSFDPCFTFAAFEDSELAVRLEARGLTIQYEPNALVYHDHFLDLEAFARREYRAGRMAVVFYRKHPRLDDMLEVAWLDRWTAAIANLAGRPDLIGRIRELDRESDAFLRSLARSLEETLEIQRALSTGTEDARLAVDALRRSLHGVLGAIFDVERVRGKIDEWYASVDEPERKALARSVVGCVRKLELFSHGRTVPHQPVRSPWLDDSVLDSLRHGIGGLPADHPVRSSRRRKLRRSAIGVARRVDRFMQGELSNRTGQAWLDNYLRLRSRLRRLLASSIAPSQRA